MTLEQQGNVQHNQKDKILAETNGLEWDTGVYLTSYISQAYFPNLHNEFNIFKASRIYMYIVSHKRKAIQFCCY